MLKVCKRCGEIEDTELCYCGDEKENHKGYENHSFTPFGCICGYNSFQKQYSSSRWFRIKRKIHRFFNEISLKVTVQ